MAFTAKSSCIYKAESTVLPIQMSSLHIAPRPRMWTNTQDRPHNSLCPRRQPEPYPEEYHTYCAFRCSGVEPLETIGSPCTGVVPTPHCDYREHCEHAAADVDTGVGMASSIRAEHAQLKLRDVLCFPVNPRRRKPSNQQLEYQHALPQAGTWFRTHQITSIYNGYQGHG